jgi:hypothetical protein
MGREDTRSYRDMEGEHQKIFSKVQQVHGLDLTVIKLIESPELALSSSLFGLSGRGSTMNIFDHVSLHGH